MGNPNIEIKIQIGEAEAMTVTGKNLDKLTGRRLRGLNATLHKRIKEARSQALRNQRLKKAEAERKKEEERKKKEAEQQEEQQSEANQNEESSEDSKSE